MAGMELANAFRCGPTSQKVQPAIKRTKFGRSAGRNAACAQGKRAHTSGPKRHEYSKCIFLFHKMVIARSDGPCDWRDTRHWFRRAIVEELASLGASVYTCARSEEDLVSCLKEWEAAGFSVKGSTCDASSREQREALFREVSSAFNGKLNILVNNVGTNIRKPTVEYTAEDFSHIISTNFESAYHNAQLAHPLLKASGKGSVIFVSSVGGVVAISSGTLYAATKGAMNQITKNLACEWAKDGIRVNTVAPWYIKTDLANQVLKDDDFTRQVISRTPLRRVGEPYEVASVAAFLCLPTAGFVSGQIITIDGGMSVNGFFPTEE